jgi:hypothetical protein
MSRFQRIASPYMRRPQMTAAATAKIADTKERETIATVQIHLHGQPLEIGLEWVVSEFWR